MRPIYQIAEDILADWERPDYAAAPYIEAMLSLNSMSDKYILDDADEIVQRFLINAGKWRGPVAREIKKELNKMVKTHQRSRRYASPRRVEILLETLANGHDGINITEDEAFIELLDRGYSEDWISEQLDERVRGPRRRKLYDKRPSSATGREVLRRIEEREQIEKFGPPRRPLRQAQVLSAMSSRVAKRHAFQQQGWVDARRFPLMFALTSRSTEFGVEAGSLVPKTAWAKAERDLSRIPMPQHLGGLAAGIPGLPFGPSETYDIIEALEVGDAATLRKLGVPSSVSQAIDALYR